MVSKGSLRELLEDLCAPVNIQECNDMSKVLHWLYSEFQVLESSAKARTMNDFLLEYVRKAEAGYSFLFVLTV